MRFLLVVCAISFLGTVASASGQGYVYLVRTGTDAEGNPMFRTADARDTYLSGVFEIERNSRPLQEVARYNQEVQRDRLAASLATRGLSPQDTRTALAAYPIEPVFVEVTNASSGAYNDWKGRFSVTYPNGQSTTHSSPRVVLPLGGDVMRSGNRGLIEQTVVHEVAHGTMALSQGRDALPETPWLSRPHSGGTVSDEPFAYIEGWSEFLGAYFTGRRTVAEDPANAFDSNWYALRADGSYKPASELVRTEGWMATVLYKVATEGRDQNAMWKLTQSMSRARAQSTMQLLAATAQYFPELAPTIDRVMSSASGGQLRGPAAGASYSGQTQVGAAGGGSGPGVDPSSIAPDSRQLEQAYVAKRQQLDAVPWWKFWEKSKIKRELAMIEDVYARQLDLTIPRAGQPAAPTVTPAPATQSAAGPAPADTTYRGVVDALKSGEADAARRALDARRAISETRRSLRELGPRPER